MTCVNIGTGFVCFPSAFVNMEPFGAKVWMEWHNYLGPTFFRSKSAIKPIMVPGPKTWKAFKAWKKVQKDQAEVKSPAAVLQNLKAMYLDNAKLHRVTKDGVNIDVFAVENDGIEGLEGDFLLCVQEYRGGPVERATVLTADCFKSTYGSEEWEVMSDV